MAQQSPPSLNGWLIAGGKKTAVEARYASRYSLWVDVNSGATGTEFDTLELCMGDRLIETGPCRLVSEPDREGPLRRLVATARTHDFEKLFFKSRVETVQPASLNLSLILGYKGGIEPSFREYVSNLTYDLNVHSSLLDQVDSEGAAEPRHVWSLVLPAITGGVEASLKGRLDAALTELGRIVHGFADKKHEQHGFYFRKQLWNTLLRAPIMARTNLKPRGYSGDSEMMRLIYLNDYQGDSTFGRMLHKYSVGQAAARAVRNRRVEITRMLHEVAQNRAGASQLRVLSVACGPAVEITDVLRSAKDCATIHLSLLDQDQQALLEAAGLIGEVEKSLGAQASVDFIRESVRTMLVTRELKERWGQFHFVYSMGLFDYLTAPVATAVMRKLYNLLSPGGELVVGNMHVRNPSRYFMEYWLDWRIIHRTEEDFLRLAADLPGCETEILFDDTGIQMLLRVRKRADV